MRASSPVRQLLPGQRVELLLGHELIRLVVPARLAERLGHALVAPFEDVARRLAAEADELFGSRHRRPPFGPRGEACRPAMIRQNASGRQGCLAPELFDRGEKFGRLLPLHAVPRLGDRPEVSAGDRGRHLPPVFDVEEEIALAPDEADRNREPRELHVVAHRPGWQAPTSGMLGELLQERRAPSAAALASKAAGYIHVQPVTQLEISSTDLRDSLRAGRDPKFLVPDSVREIIIETECYAESL